MSASEFTGMRKVTIRDTSTGNTGTFTVQGADKIGSDGFMIALESNEVTTSSFAGDTVSPNGTNLSAATLPLIPLSIDDIAAIFPEGYDSTTGSWQPIIGGCTLNDVTFVFEKVCDTKGNIILRHATVALAFELAISRDDTTMIELSIYPSLSEGSEYGLAGDLATEMIPYQIFDGVYDPTTDEVDFDVVPS
jgi:hypothetical protein